MPFIVPCIKADSVTWNSEALTYITLQDIMHVIWMITMNMLT